MFTSISQICINSLSGASGLHEMHLSFISLSTFEFYQKAASELYSFLLEMTNHSLAKLLLGGQCVIQGIQKLDGYREMVISNLAFIITTKWKPLLFIFTMILCIFRLLQMTCKSLLVYTIFSGSSGDYVTFLTKVNVNEVSLPKTKMTVYFCSNASQKAVIRLVWRMV